MNSELGKNIRELCLSIAFYRDHFLSLKYIIYQFYNVINSFFH